MKFSVKQGKTSGKHGPCCVIGAYQSKDLKGLAGEIDTLTGGALKKRIDSGDFEGKKEQILVIYDPPGLNSDRLVIVGYGKEDDADARCYRAACAAVARKLRSMKLKSATVWLVGDEVAGCDAASRAKHLVEAMRDTVYEYDHASRKKKRTDVSVVLAVDVKNKVEAVKKGVAQGSAVAEGSDLARDLANLPPNICTPTYLARQARGLQKKYPLKSRVLNESDMKKLGMGSLLSVSRGSRQPAKLIVMEYSGGPKSQRPVVLVGKGLTFDAGGISLKPAAKMDEMKYDMCGAASVFGALVAAAEMKLPLNVVAIVPSSENLPDGDANKPGDVVTSMSGKTIEVLNTDAEGRLILCDALTYAERFKPEAVIDIATLTGACIVALGHQTSGMMSNDQELADELTAAGDKSLDRIWQLPLWEDYQSQLDSNFADMANIGGPGAGTITAGCFLSRFAESFKWGHLDIAGTAWRSGGKSKGATGRVVPLLSQFLINRAT